MKWRIADHIVKWAIIVGSGLFLATQLRCQPAQVQPQPDMPHNNWYGAGGSWNSTAPAGTSAGAGWAGFGTLVNKTIGLWQFNLYNAYLVKVPGMRAQIASSVTAGAALNVRTIGPLSLYAFGTAGIATAGANAGNSFPYGGFLDFRIASSLWHLDAGYMQAPSSLAGVATQKVVMFGVGRLF